MRFTTLALVGVATAAPIAKPQWGGLSSLFGGSSTTKAPAASTSSSSGLGALAGLFGGGGSSGGSGANALSGLAGLFGGGGSSGSSSASSGLSGLFSAATSGSSDSSIITNGYNNIRNKVAEVGTFVSTLGASVSSSDISKLNSLNRGQIDALKGLATGAQGMSGEINLIAAAGIAEPGQNLIKEVKKTLDLLTKAMPAINTVPGASKKVLSDLQETLEATKSMMSSVDKKLPDIGKSVAKGLANSAYEYINKAIKAYEDPEKAIAFIKEQAARSAEAAKIMAELRAGTYKGPAKPIKTS